MKHLTTIITILIWGGCGQNQNAQTNNSDSTTNYKTENTLQTSNKTDKKDSNYEKWFEPTALDTTLIFLDNLQLTLKHTDSIFINEYYLNSKIIDSLTKPHDNRHIEALEIEKYLLKTYNNFAKRDTNGLYIKLQNGNWKLLTLDSMTDETDNTFEYYFENFGFYSIRVQWGEGNGYKLVNKLDGTETNLFGRPYFSPNGQLIISVNADIEAGYSSNGFQLFKNENGKLELLGNYQPSTWGPYIAKWTDNDKLVLKNQTLEFKDGDMNYTDFFLEIKIKNGD